MTDDPLVSICCATYNHERFVRQALDSFLAQETAFAFEVLVNDDASTDGTPAILREYERAHPDVVKVVYQEENRFSEGGVSLLRDFLLPRARGRYVAVCEGDDRWLTTDRLQRQVTFLEANPAYSLCCGGYLVDDGESQELRSFARVGGTVTLVTGDAQAVGDPFDVILEDLYNAWVVKTLTLVFRLDLYDPALFETYAHVRDVHFIYNLLWQGPGRFLPEPLGVYNVHGGGIHSEVGLRRRSAAALRVYGELYEAHGWDLARRKYALSIMNSIVTGVVPEETPHGSTPRMLWASLSLVRRPAELVDLLKAAVSPLHRAVGRWRSGRPAR